MSDQPDKTKAPGLLDEPPILVYPSLACLIGINAAIVLQQLHYLINATKKAKSKYNLIDGEWWVYNTYKEWHDEQFPWLSESAIKGIFLSLEKRGIVKSRQSVKHKSDRRKWYTIDYKAWAKFYTINGQNLSDDETKNVRSTMRQKMSDGYAETTTETTTKKKDSIPPSGEMPTVSNTADDSKPIDNPTSSGPTHNGDPVLPAGVAKGESSAPAYSKSLAPGNVTPAQHKAQLPALLLGVMIHTPPEGDDIGHYLKVLKTLAKSGIDASNIGDFIDWIQQHENGLFIDQPLAGNGQWHITISSLTGKGRPSRYMAYKRGWTTQTNAPQTTQYHRAPENPPPIPDRDERLRRMKAGKESAGWPT